MKSLFVYKSPALAIAAIAALTLVFILNVLPMDHVDKFSFLLAMGLAVYFLVVSGKAMQHSRQNLACLMFVVALLMILIGVVLTSKSTLAASALEDLTNPIIGGIGGFFSGVEKDED